jgi:hypothetical protein
VPDSSTNLSTEHSRKHGPFDRRYPPFRHKPAPASLWRLGEEPIDWKGFLARFFPGSRRHDFDALAAYESYRDDDDAAAHVARLDNALRGGDETEPPAAGETERWEGEGGAVVSDVSRRNGFSGDEAGGLDVELEYRLRDLRMNVSDDDPVVAPARSVNIVE